MTHKVLFKCSTVFNDLSDPTFLIGQEWLNWKIVEEMKMSLFGCVLFALAFAFAFACMIDFNIEYDLVPDLFQV